MMQVVQKWKIIIRHPMTDKNDLTIYIYENHGGNLLRKLADINFDFEPLGFNIFKVE